MSKISKYIGNVVSYDIDIAKNYIKKIQNFLKNRLKQANANGFIVGISGGIDSSLVYMLAKSIKPNDTLGVVMPIKKMTEMDLKHIRELQNVHRDNFLTVDLSDSFETLTKTLNLCNDLSIANIKPRLRMTTLYALAQERNYLVVGTDNADEVFIGYFTKYGDGGVDLLPISKLTKGEVKFISKIMQVPDSIINKKPSAGLWDGQTDESELGFSYDDLDFYLNHQNQKELIEQHINPKVIEKIEYKHKITKHKREKIYTVKNIK
ncbi:NAD(+) synthase [Mycoplasmopsis canis]|uniref:NAD(+) synthase n=1 Tax=Mycoplasmopsis cynos TaxID=171284 RepID=UPI002AFFD336|nr:NAD(+) synthase [Mycoplasmopsis cynos]WQQ13226.1 NAD(+) synthase [Mycoplasmopsis cynos]WQQ13883.1 NAD(+) synthase [Mycoplasmopsis cynos]